MSARSGRRRRPARTVTAVALWASAVLLSGCGSAGTGQQTSAKGGVPLVEAGRLTVCTHLPDPPFQVEKDGEVVGFDVDLIDLVADELGVEQSVVDVPFETIRSAAALNAGQCDLAAAGFTITEERRKNMSFSRPYYDADQAVLTDKGAGVSSLADLRGRAVGSMTATTGEDYLRGKGLDPQSFVSTDAQLNALRTGQVDAVVQDLPVVQEWLRDSANSEFGIALRIETGEQFGFALRKDGTEKLLKVVDATLQRARSDGTYDRLYEKWFGRAPEGATS
ncbi:transporter substrate-binding domain-containing protein [Streptomyces sp. PRKS01-65]|nr:transporter substrate-binding domain-containing protein [Streptomyces harenosi]NEY30963.1 transporter substrate-binding domain-containing protein [Streptomyces harenosi]